MNKESLQINEDSFLELCNIADGTFSPLRGFLTSKDYQHCVDYMHLLSGAPWTIPITLEISEKEFSTFRKEERLTLIFEKENVGTINVEDLFKVDYDNDIKKIFQTDSKNHPGVAKELSRSPYRVGGEITLFKKANKLFPQYELSPSEIKQLFSHKGWTTIAGFQTRNPPHRAHEYLQRVALEVCDGLFIQPLIGWKKEGDFSPTAVLFAYRHLVEHFYPKNSTLLGTLRTPMRYAGPREAIFHALIRKNFGCTHFIIGRDHAGVGNYYGKYEAHNLCRQFNDLGIEILYLHGPYFCEICENIVTEKTCNHKEEEKKNISGTLVREMFSQGKRPPKEYMRREISDTLLKLSRESKLFYRGELL